MTITEPKPSKTGTTIRVTQTTKEHLDRLKTAYDKPDYDSVVAQLISAAPETAADPSEVHIVMSKSKYTWLLAKSPVHDVRETLRKAVR